MIPRILLSLAIALTMLRCVDTTPIVVDTKIGDAGTTGADGASPEACRECLFGDGGGCLSEYAACQSVPNCKTFFACVLVYECTSIEALQDRIACTAPCMEQTILTSTDPAIEPLVALSNCSLSTCHDACITR